VVDGGNFPKKDPLRERQLPFLTASELSRSEALGGVNKNGPEPAAAQRGRGKKFRRGGRQGNDRFNKDPPNSPKDFEIAKRRKRV